MNILITGSNGFVGSRLMYELESENHKVFGIDKSIRCNIEPHPNTFIGDIRKIENYGCFNDHNLDLIIHAAAEKHDFGISKDEYFSNNKYGTEVLMQFADLKGISKVIYYSTVSVYGHQTGQCDETAPLKPNNYYGESKLAGEEVIIDWQKRDNKREVIILRPSVIYGPNNYANMYNLINQLHKFPLFMIGNGEHIKSIISLDNIVDLTIFILNKLKPGVQFFNTIDKPYLKLKKLIALISDHKRFYKPFIRIPLGLGVAVGKLFDLLAEILKKDLPLNTDRIMKFATSTDFRAEKIREMGYEQKYSTDDELSKTIKWYLTSGKTKL